MPYSFSRFVYLDTNIYGYLTQRQGWRKAIAYLLHGNDLCLGVGEQNVAELRHNQSLHETLSHILVYVPSVLLKSIDLALDEQHQNQTVLTGTSVVHYFINQLAAKTDGVEQVRSWFRSTELRKVREQQLQLAELAVRKIKCQVSKHGGPWERKYANEYAKLKVVQWLSKRGHDVSNIDPGSAIYDPIRLFGLIEFQRFYLDRIVPKRSCFGDLYHCFAYPYCKLVVVENSIADTIEKIKRYSNVLDNVDVLSTTQLRSYCEEGTIPWDKETDRLAR